NAAPKPAPRPSSAIRETEPETAWEHTSCSVCFATLRRAVPGAPAPHRVEVVASWGMSRASAPVVELTSELHKRLILCVVREVHRPGRTPVLILEYRGRRLTVVVQVADDPHGGPAGGKKDLVLLRLHVLTGPPPPAPHQDLQRQLLDLRFGRFLCGLVPSVLCGAEALDKLHDDLQMCHGLRVRPLRHASSSFVFCCRSSPAL